MPDKDDLMALATIAAVQHFNQVFNDHDVDAVMAAMTDDCVFENTSPQPDGTHYEGQPNVRAFWDEFFRASPKAHFEAEEIFACEDRCVVRWIYSWENADGVGHVRGVDLIRIEDGKVAEKLSYVKG